MFVCSSCRSVTLRKLFGLRSQNFFVVYRRTVDLQLGSIDICSATVYCEITTESHWNFEVASTTSLNTGIYDYRVYKQSNS